MPLLLVRSSEQLRRAVRGARHAGRNESRLDGALVEAEESKRVRSAECPGAPHPWTENPLIVVPSVGQVIPEFGELG
jgi:hypothetical protein